MLVCSFLYFVNIVTYHMSFAANTIFSLALHVNDGVLYNEMLFEYVSHFLGIFV
jgi:hypothetical protein